MDSFMVDTSNVINCHEGNEVEIFGPENTILELSKKLDQFRMKYIQHLTEESRGFTLIINYY